MVAAIIASAAVAAVPDVAVAAAGFAEFATQSGQCHQNLNGTVTVVSPKVIVYGRSYQGSDLVEVWYRLVDTAGNAQSQWYFGGAAYPTASAPATFNPMWVTRPGANTHSRIQVHINWFTPQGVFGGGSTGTVQSYASYSYTSIMAGGILGTSKSFAGYTSTCFG